MRLEDWWYDWHLEELLEGYLPDFILAFAFFTSVVYAALGKRFEQQRPAIAMSTAIGLALSLGLVWWEQANDFSIKNLGPIAVGFAILLLAFVMYQSIRHVGGSWAGAGIALGASILVAGVLGIRTPVHAEVLRTLAAVLLVIGISVLLLRHHGHALSPSIHLEPSGPDPDMSRLFRERHLSHEIERRLNGIRRQSATLRDRPEQAADVVRQIRQMLPAQGHLTDRMAKLRAKAHQIRNGHIARLEETRHVYAKLPRSVKKQAAAELAAAYNQMIGMDTRLERLDRAVAENEKRIREATQKAQDRAMQYDHRGLVECLKGAERLQKHNSRLFKTIESTEAKLTAIAKQIAVRAKQVEQE